jgi:hypothetical protein
MVPQLGHEASIGSERAMKTDPFDHESCTRPSVTASSRSLDLHVERHPYGARTSVLSIMRAALKINTLYVKTEKYSLDMC